MAKGSGCHFISNTLILFTLHYYIALKINGNHN